MDQEFFMKKIKDFIKNQLVKVLSQKSRLQKIQINDYCLILINFFIFHSFKTGIKGVGGCSVSITTYTPIELHYPTIHLNYEKL